jgi:hypothetical protein
MSLTGDEQARVVDLLAEIVPRVMREEFDGAVNGLCLNATRVGFEALRYFGIPSTPVVLSAIAANREWLEWRSKWDDAESQLAVGPMPGEAWSVALGFGQNPSKLGGSGYDAHLALAVGAGGYLLVDLDSGQMSRPERGIHVEPGVVVPWDGKAAWVELPEGGAIAYGLHVATEPLPNYRQAGGWRKSGQYAGPVIREIRGRLNSPATLPSTPTTEEA